MKTLIQSLAQLASLKRGDTFSYGGHDCICYADGAISTNRFTSEPYVSLRAGRAHAGMPSGYEAADILAYQSDIDRLAA